MQLITWNVQWCRGLDGRVDPKRIARTAREIADFDVLCLQEVAANFPGLKGGHAEDEVALLAEALPGYGVHYVAALDVPDGRGGRAAFGNLILTRLPVGQVFRHRLPWPADPACPSMQRALIEAVIQAPFGPVRVMTTHLEYYSTIQRAAQVEAIRDIQREACAQARAPRPGGEAGEPIFNPHPRPACAVLTGDMNLKPDWPEHARLVAPFDDGTLGFLDAWMLAHPGVPHAPTVDIHTQTLSDAPYCCDFIFVTKDLAPRVEAVEVIVDTRASDHQPMLLTLDDRP